MDWVAQEFWIRIGFFVGGFLLFGGLGLLFSFRKKAELNSSRWMNNMGLTLFNSFIIRLLFPFSLVYLAPFLQEYKVGLFNNIPIPPWLNVVLSFLVLDAVVYFQHVIFHRVDFLWRLHRVHHTDIGFDTTTALRFHPMEIFLSMLIKFTIVVLLGSNALAILVFEVLLNFSAMFNHGNFTLPASLDKALRFVLVTPDMHRIHHSVIVDETNSNYGFFLSWWDRIFKTHVSQSKADLQVDEIGIEIYRSLEDQRLDHLLAQPFR